MLTPSMTGPSRRRLRSHEVLKARPRSSVAGVLVRRGETPRDHVCIERPCDDVADGGHLQTRKRSHAGPQPCRHLDLGPQPPELREKKVPWWSHLVCGVRRQWPTPTPTPALLRVKGATVRNPRTSRPRDALALGVQAVSVTDRVTDGQMWTTETKLIRTRAMETGVSKLRNCKQMEEISPQASLIPEQSRARERVRAHHGLRLTGETSAGVASTRIPTSAGLQQGPGHISWGDENPLSF